MTQLALSAGESSGTDADRVIHLTCIADSRYLRHTGAMLHSALGHCARGNLAISVLHTEPIEEAERVRLRQVTDAGGAALEFVYVPERAIAGMPQGVFGRSIWLRIFLPELMPQRERVLYLDSDLIVTDDLRALWETPLGANLVAAVTNPIYPFMRPHPREDLGIPRPQDYFNSGVLLMNLELMRREGTAAKIGDFARANPQIGAPDQDALNVVCRDRWLKLHPRWNVQSTLFELKPAQLPFPPEQIAQSLASPAIIHFIGPSKPWHYLCTHPRQALYFAHARATPWGEPAITGRNLRTMVLRQLPLAWTYRWGAVERVIRRALRRSA